MLRSTLHNKKNNRLTCCSKDNDGKSLPLVIVFHFNAVHDDLLLRFVRCLIEILFDPRFHPIASLDVVSFSAAITFET